MNTTTAINAYKNVKVESGVNGADPLKLIVMLYQGALLAIASAKNQMQRKEIAAKGESIGKAIRIIDEGLKCSLDMNVNGELVHNLAALYDYMNQRLVLANLNNDPAILDEVSGLLSELKGAWEAIRPGAQNASTDETLSTSSPASTGITNSSVPQSAIGKQAALVYGRM
jgi:flagellar secretion chaperone FliS